MLTLVSRTHNIPLRAYQACSVRNDYQASHINACLSSSLFALLSLTQTLLSLSVPIYRQEWCYQLQLIFNNGGCQLQLFFNNGGCQPLTLGMGCCICQWTVPSINGCCTLMATNPTCSSSMYFLCRMIFILLY